MESPLHERIRFMVHGGFASLRQPQLELKPFDADRLKAVALRLRDLFPASEPDRVTARASTEFIMHLVAQATIGFRGDVGVVPRQFLRAFVHQLDLVDEHAEYDPMTAYGFTPAELRPEEQEALAGEGTAGASPAPVEDDGPVKAEDVW